MGNVVSVTLVDKEYFSKMSNLDPIIPARIPNERQDRLGKQNCQ